MNDWTTGLWCCLLGYILGMWIPHFARGVSWLAVRRKKEPAKPPSQVQRGKWVAEIQGGGRLDGRRFDIEGEYPPPVVQFPVMGTRPTMDLSDKGLNLLSSDFMGTVRLQLVGRKTVRCFNDEDATEFLQRAPAFGISYAQAKKWAEHTHEILVYKAEEEE